MGEFQRSPSKVWWSDDCHNWPRRTSASPGSQDSGFSDTETSPPAPQCAAEQAGETPKKEIAQRVSKDILKNIMEEDYSNSQNLTVNFKQKITPKKSIKLEFGESKGSHSVSLYLPRTPPVNRLDKLEVQSEPVKRQRFRRNGSLKISRGLFKSSKQSKESHAVPVENTYQYAREIINDDVESQYSSANSKVKLDDSQLLWKSDDNCVELPEGVRTFPLISDNNFTYDSQRKRSAPSILLQNETYKPISPCRGDNSLQSSDCESELESAFHGLLDLPKHTSTPKTCRNFGNMKHNRSKRILRLLNTQEDSPLNLDEEPIPLQKWAQETRNLYEGECMTTLQCKSIAAELAQKVNFIANRMIGNLRNVLIDSQTIVTEFQNIKSQKQHTGPLAQSFARLIEEFVQKYATNSTKSILKICEDIRHAQNEDVLKMILHLNSCWETLKHKVVVKEVKAIVNELADPTSETHVRAALIGLTSIALRNKQVTDILIANNSIQILCVLCEKCESSTVRALVLRSLATICNDNHSVRQFESACGIHLISEIVSEYTRPEPERSEAVALLAQVTAPWIEDNRNVKGLQEQLRILVKALTAFISSTKCCQNILLCTAALANLSEMEPKSIEYILHQNSIRHILRVIKLERSLVSVYLLEQTATLIANLSLKIDARKSLTEEGAATALLHFIHCNHTDPEVSTRLQQKSVIALSRLSSDHDAAQQIVKSNGVGALVTLCRERKERYDSDAVLVAALATLRKIVEACGKSVIDAVDVQELVEPKLLDSFLAYSTQNESYV